MNLPRISLILIKNRKKRKKAPFEEREGVVKSGATNIYDLFLPTPLLLQGYINVTILNTSIHITTITHPKEMKIHVYYPKLPKTTHYLKKVFK